MRVRMMLWLSLATSLACPVLAAETSGGPAAFHPEAQPATLDLTQVFHTRSPWRLVATAGPPVKDYGENDAPGPLTLCLYKGPTGPCVSEPVTPPLRTGSPEAPTLWEPHYLLAAKAVFPQGPRAAPLLMIVTGSLNRGRRSDRNHPIGALRHRPRRVPARLRRGHGP